MIMTKGQLKGMLARQARAKARLQVVLEAADQGRILEEAAQAAGMKPAGVRTMLWQKFGSTKYPPQPENHSCL